MNISKIINHLCEEREKYDGFVNPPVFQTSNFAAKSVNDDLLATIPIEIGEIEELMNK